MSAVGSLPDEPRMSKIKWTPLSRSWLSGKQAESGDAKHVLRRDARNDSLPLHALE